MCGIAGFFGRRRLDAGARARMLEILAPRGPDARGLVAWDERFTRTEGPAPHALLHTRLAIRDLSTAADQPMANAAGDIWICYNGEVYGWEEDAEWLRRRGYVFRTRSDTEFILHGYAEWGLGVIDKLRGMFALAILDLRAHRLHLVRDRLGIKPLVYFYRDGELAFGSTVRAVLPYLTAEERRLAPEAIDAYLAHRYIPAPRTVFAAIRRLPNGHRASLDLTTGELHIEPYWHPRPDPARGDFSAVLTESVRLRTVADRPVGLFLSGGVDSATVASILAETGHLDIVAYTAAFPGTEYDEATTAASVARALGLRHQLLPIALDSARDFERIVAALDEPFADPSSFPLWYLARAASAHVRVVMGGDGGDELFAGYKRYAKHLASRWRGRLRFPALARRAPRRLPGRWRKLADELALDWLSAYSLRFSGMPPSLRRFLQPDFRTGAGIYWDRMPDREQRQGLSALLEIDMNNYLPEYILRKADLCTMAHGLELRVPLLDHRLYQAVLALPPAERFTHPPKLALAHACGVCQQLDLFAQKKRGFNPPLDRWLRHGELATHLAGLGARLEAATGGQLAARRVETFVAAYLAGDKRSAQAEQVLQLVILDVSLAQLTAYAPHRLH
jgi:asparagine synthase (glutamine-hydrolysing)